MIAIRAQPVIPVRLGKQGENNVISIEFDISKWIEELGDGTSALLHMRPEDDSPYLVSTTLEDGIVTWVVSSTDTAQAGTGKCELQYVSETGEVIKSETWLTTIAASLEEAGESPDPESGWVADLLAQIQELIDSMETISEDDIEAALENYLAENPIKDAYDYAVDGGYTGTEEEFATMLATVVTLVNTEEESY